MVNIMVKGSFMVLFIRFALLQMLSHCDRDIYNSIAVKYHA